MRSRTAFILFIAAQPIFIFLHIYKNNVFIRHTYAYQKKVARKNELLKKKEQLNQQLCQLENKQKIKEYAQNFLCMEKVKLNQIKKLDHA